MKNILFCILILFKFQNCTCQIQLTNLSTDVFDVIDSNFLFAESYKADTSIFKYFQYSELSEEGYGILKDSMCLNLKFNAYQYSFNKNYYFTKYDFLALQKLSFRDTNFIVNKFVMLMKMTHFTEKFQSVFKKAIKSNNFIIITTPPEFFEAKYEYNDIQVVIKMTELDGGLIIYRISYGIDY